MERGRDSGSRGTGSIWKNAKDSEETSLCNQGADVNEAAATLQEPLPQPSDPRQKLSYTVTFNPHNSLMQLVNNST